MLRHLAVIKKVKHELRGYTVKEMYITLPDSWDAVVVIYNTNQGWGAIRVTLDGNASGSREWLSPREMERMLEQCDTRHPGSVAHYVFDNKKKKEQAPIVRAYPSGTVWKAATPSYYKTLSSTINYFGEWT
jgi:hypothetical protein